MPFLGPVASGVLFPEELVMESVSKTSYASAPDAGRRPFGSNIRHKRTGELNLIGKVSQKISSRRPPCCSAAPPLILGQGGES